MKKGNAKGFEKRSAPYEESVFGGCDLNKLGLLT